MCKPFKYLAAALVSMLFAAVFPASAEKENENIIEGRNAVMEAFRSGKPVDKLYVLDEAGKITEFTVK